MLCAPSLGGESFGMVLTEAFAAGTTVVASDIAGYRDVVSDGVDGVLVPPGDAQALAEALRDLYDEPERRARAGARRGRATCSGSPGSASPREVMEAYKDAIAMPAAGRARASASAVRTASSRPICKPRVRAERLASLEPAADGRSAARAAARASCAASALAAAVDARRRSRARLQALQKIGIDNIAKALVNSSPSFVLLGLATMCLAMVMRAFSWHAILQAALPKARVRLVDALQGTMIGVLMSSTLPARLGEPSRALVVARRTGARARTSRSCSARSSRRRCSTSSR